MINYALITGAGSGIGKAAALRMAQRKIPLILVGRSESLEPTCKLIAEKGGAAEIFNADLENYEQWQKNLAQLIFNKGDVHWGVILAASTLGPQKEECRLSNFSQLFNINVIGNLAVLEACLPKMEKAQFGRVVFFAGGGAAYAYPEFPAYALSKVSTVRLTENLAATYPSDSGISFICLAPGAVDTPMLAKVIAAGGAVKTKTSIEEPVNFIEEYCFSDSMLLNGRYLHVRDDWPDYLSGKEQLSSEQFFLRRT